MRRQLQNQSVSGQTYQQATERAYWQTYTQKAESGVPYSEAARTARIQQQEARKEPTKRQAEHQSLSLTGLRQEIAGYPSGLRPILEPLFENDERLSRVEEKLRNIREDKALLSMIASNFLNSLTFDILNLSKDDGPLGRLANPVPASFQADLWSTAFSPSQEDSGRRRDGGADPAVSPQTGKGGSDPAVSPQTGKGGSDPPSKIQLLQWAGFREHSIDGISDFVAAYHEAILATYENFNVEISAGTDVASVSFSGFIQKIRDWAHPRDLLAIWRSTPRTLLLPQERGTNIDQTELGNLDKELFDTAKFAQFDRRITTLTYGDGAYGSITIYKTEEPRHAQAPHGVRSMRPISAMAHVPKAILIKMDHNLPSANKTALRVKKQKIEWVACKAEAIPTYVILENSGQRVGRGYGCGLADSLSIDSAANDADGILATIQQMLALWHIKASILYNVTSTDVRVIRNPSAIGYVTFAPGQVWRGVQILKGPDQTGHESQNPMVVVIHSVEGSWVKERMLWS